MGEINVNEENNISNIRLPYTTENVSYPQNITLDFICYGIVNSSVAFLGIIGNIATIVILQRKEMKSAASRLLCGLFVTDIGVLFFGFILGSKYLTEKIANLNYVTYVVYPKLFTPIRFLFKWFRTANVFCTVAIAVDRYIGVCKPIYYRLLRPTRTTWIILGSILFFSFLVDLPNCFATTFIPCTNRTSDECFTVGYTDFGRAFFTHHYVWTHSIFLYIIPIIFIICCSGRIAFRLSKVRKKATIMNRHGGSSSEKRTSFVVLLIVIAFVVCHTLGAVVSFFPTKQNETERAIIVISNSLIMISSAVNIFLYAVGSETFRKQAFGIVC